MLVLQDRRRVWHRDDRDRQRAPGREPGVEVLGLRRTGGIVDRSDAVPPELPGADGDVLRPPVRVAVRGHRAGMRLAPRALEQQPGRLTRSSAPDLAAGRIGRGPPDAERVERTRAHDALVQRVVRDDDWSVDARGVEIGACRRVAGVALVPTGEPDPARVGRALGLGADGGGQPGRIADRRRVAPDRLQCGRPTGGCARR